MKAENRLTINRRSLLLDGTAAALAGAATVNVTAIATARASEPDPVFAAIEEHRRLHAVVRAHGKNEPPVGHPDLPAWEARNEQACDDEAEAAAAFAETVPTTAAGIAAFADYIDNTSSLLEHHQFLESAFPTLAEAARNLIGGRA